jgi:hypothetical protein
MFRVIGRRAVLLPAVGALCLCAGCYTRTSQGDRTTYAFAGWLLALIIVAALAALPAAWFLRKRSGKWAFVLGCMAPIVLILAVPSMFRDRVEVSPAGFRMSTGLWFAPNSHQYEFDQLAGMELRARTVQGRGGPHEEYDLVCRPKGGTPQSVPIGDLMRFAVREIVEAAKAKGVPVTGEQLLPNVEEDFYKRGR